MVPTDPSRKRIALLFIFLTVISLSVDTASAATKKVASATHTVSSSTKKATSSSSSTKKTVTTTPKTKKTITAKKTTKKSVKKTTKTKKPAAKIAKQVKASVIAADRQMVITDNNIPAVPISAATAQTVAVTSMTVTNPVTDDTYAIDIQSPQVTVIYPIPPNDVRGYYAQPISGRLSQGIHDVNAVDISAPVGTVVHAAAQGIITAVTNDDGYNGGYGNYIVISHPNGTETLYAHLSYATVKAGDVVSQGQPIGFSGRTGEVTGPHLHFEVRGATNPWGSDPIGTTYTI